MSGDKDVSVSHTVQSTIVEVEPPPQQDRSPRSGYDLKVNTQKHKQSQIETDCTAFDWLL